MIKRPLKKEFVTVEWAGEPSYIGALDEYCDKLEKAYENACELLSGVFNDHEDERVYWQGYKWEEYFLDE